MYIFATYSLWLTENCHREEVGEMELIGFVLFNEIWLQCLYDHTFLKVQITRSDVKPHIKWAVSLVIAYGHF